IAGPGEIVPHPNLFGHGGRFLYRPAGFRYFDSLAIEECGNICVATIGEPGVSVISPEGELVDFVPTPDLFTTNICFGGDDMRTAYIT
ncbi:MAG: SMP-30/gluconolactonase/LRE family protein, partial [Sphingopyxis sp.]